MATAFLVDHTPWRPSHCFDLYAGPLGFTIILCSLCGRRAGIGQPDACTPLPTSAKRAQLETEIAKATADLEEHRRLSAAATRRRELAAQPAYQNVSAVVRNVVGGWNRR